MSKKVCIYDTDEVIDKECDAILEKYGSSTEVDEMIKKKFYEYFEESLNELKEALESDDDEKIRDLIEHTIEEENGDIWICVKVFNVNKWQTKFGTEP